jgi:putative CocE/NonD family hydrolase
VSFRARLAAALAVAAAVPLSVVTLAHADGGFTEYPVSIPASQPDDNSNPVTLDGAVDVPNSGCPCPVVVINHGFLGSWHDSGDVASAFANHGYIVLRYSSRGFGNSPGQVDLVGPKEQQDFLDAVHFVNDEKAPQLTGLVIHNDVGQYGGSYGGGHAWYAAMSGDPAIRTAIPTATWTDFYQALLPNDVMLAAYVNGFYATGYDPTASVANNVTSGHPQPAAPDLTQNYSTELHRWIAEANSGADVADLKAGLDSRSVMYNLDKVHIPVFIIQGSNDGLFSENQALEAYQALHAHGVPARLYIGGIGHPPSDGSTGSNEAIYVGNEMLAWFDHYLKGVDNGIDRQPPIEFSHTTYFNNQQPCTKLSDTSAECTTRSAYTFPAGPSTSYFLCPTGPSGGDLSTTPCADANPVVATNLAGLGGGYDQEPVTRNYVQEGINQLTCQPNEPICQQQDPDLSSYPAILTYDAPAVTADTEWFGPPHLDLQTGSVDVLPAGVEGAAAAFQLDPKFYDVAPDGTTKLITRGAYAEPLNAAAPSQQTIPSHEVGYDAFGLSYVLPAGHHLRLTLSTSDVPYLRPTVNPFAVALFAGSKLDVPTAADSFTWGPAHQIGDPGPGPGPSVPEAPLPILLVLLAVAGIAAVQIIRRRHTP